MTPLAAFTWPRPYVSPPAQSGTVQIVSFVGTNNQLYVVGCVRPGSSPWIPHNLTQDARAVPLTVPLTPLAGYSFNIDDPTTFSIIESSAHIIYISGFGQSIHELYQDASDDWNDKLIAAAQPPKHLSV